MPYSSSTASPRPELSVFLEESHGAEEGLIATQVLPVIDQPTRNGEYPRIRRGKGELMNHYSTRRAMDGSYNEGSRAIEWDTYDCVEYGWTERIDDARAKELARFFDAEKLTAKLNKRVLLFDHEKRVADLMADYSTIGVTPVDAKVPYTENNLENIDFPFDIKQAQERMKLMGLTPNTLVMNLTIFNLLSRSLKLQGFLFGRMENGVYKIIAPDDLVKPFMIKTILIASGAYNSAGKTVAGTFTGSYFWSNAFVWLMEVQGGDFSEGGSGRTITWQADCPGGLFTTESYRNEDRRGDMIRTRTQVAEKIVDAGAIQMIRTNWVAPS